MIRNRVLLLVCFVVAFAAGTTAGLLLAKSGRRPHGYSWLMAELNLTDQQRDQIHKIWSEVMETSAKQHWEQRKAITEERDKAIVAMLTPEQQPKYEQILQEYDRKLGELSQQRKRAFEQAIERTRGVLTPDQAKQYDELLKRQRERGFGGPRPQHMGPRSRPSSDEHRTPRGGE